MTSFSALIGIHNPRHGFDRAGVFSYPGRGARRINGHLRGKGRANNVTVTTLDAPRNTQEMSATAMQVNTPKVNATILTPRRVESAPTSMLGNPTAQDSKTELENYRTPLLYISDMCRLHGVAGNG